MKPHHKVLLEVVFSIFALLGLVQSYLQGERLLAVACGLFLLLILEIIRRDLSSVPYWIEEVSFCGRILDAAGSRAEVFKTTRFIPLEKNLSVIYDRNLGATGKLILKGTSTGALLAPFDEGGTLTVATIWPTPLSRWRSVEKVLSMEAIDSFTADRETFTHNVTDDYGRLHLRIDFPEARPFKEMKCLYYQKTAAGEIADLRLQPDRRSAEVFIEKPLRGAKVVLSWQW